MATHLSILAWKIPWTEEPDKLQSMGSQRVRLDLAIGFHFHTVSMGVIFIGSHFPIFIRVHCSCPLPCQSLFSLGVKKIFYEYFIFRMCCDGNRRLYSLKIFPRYMKNKGNSILLKHYSLHKLYCIIEYY